MQKKTGKIYHRTICYSCRYKAKRTYYEANPEIWAIQKQCDKINRQLARQDNTQRAKFIVRDSRKTDKKRNLENDLTIEWVQDAISRGCFYCGSMEKMSLDRKDNSIGHVKDNLIPACWRCNYIRRDMPIDAWLLLTPMIRQIHEWGLFGDWRAGGRAF